jgi:hypothetical protein
MADVVGSLWPSDIRPNVLSPFAILEPQAKALAAITRGILVGEIKVEYGEGRKKTLLHFDILVPALDGYRRRILTASHQTDMIYPVRVDADCFRPITLHELETAVAPRRRQRENEAATDEEFRELVEKVLQSAEVKAIAVSLIARANDVLKARQSEAEAQAGTGGPPRPEELPPSDVEGRDGPRSDG